MKEQMRQINRNNNKKGHKINDNLKNAANVWKHVCQKEEKKCTQTNSSNGISTVKTVTKHGDGNAADSPYRNQIMYV